MAQRFFEKADLARALGGFKVLIQLLDKDGDGVPDAVLVDGICDDSSALMASMIERSVSLASLHAPFPRALVMMAAQLGAFQAWVEGSEGQACPENVQKGYDAAMRWGTDVGDRKASVGTVTRPSLDPPVRTVDPDPAATGISIAGFKRGFR